MFIYQLDEDKFRQQNEIKTIKNLNEIKLKIKIELYELLTIDHQRMCPEIEVCSADENILLYFKNEFESKIQQSVAPNSYSII